MVETDFLPDYFIVEKWRSFLKANPHAKERAGLSFHSDVPPEFRYEAKTEGSSLTLNLYYSSRYYPTIWRLVSKAYMQHLKDLIDERNYVVEEESLRNNFEWENSKDILLKNLAKENRNIQSIRIKEDELWSRVNQIKKSLPETKERKRIIEDFHEIFMPLISRDKPLLPAFFVGELGLFSKSYYHFRRGRYNFKMPEKSNYWINHQNFEELLRKITNPPLHYSKNGDKIQFTFEIKGLFELPLFSTKGLTKREGVFSLKYRSKRFVFEEKRRVAART